MALEPIWITVIALSSIILLMLIGLTIFFAKKASNKKKKPKKAEIKIQADKKIPNKELKTKKEQEPDQLYYEAPSSEYFQRTIGKIRRWRDRRRAKKHPATSVLIKMEMKNGRHREFTVKEDAQKTGFVLNKGRYIFDPKAKYYIIDSNIWAYDYYEGFNLPIKRTVPIDKIRDNLEAAAKMELLEVENAVNPIWLERFIRAEIAQGILRGASLGALFKLLVILVIITMFIMGVDLLVDIYGSGLIEQFSNRE